jgi:hypothetical protein
MNTISCFGKTGFTLRSAGICVGTDESAQYDRLFASSWPALKNSRSEKRVKMLLETLASILRSTGKAWNS